MQRGTTHLHSFVIPEETKCSGTQSHDRVTHRGPQLTYRMQKKEEEGRKWLLESGTSWKQLLCNALKPGRVHRERGGGHVRQRLVQTKNQRWADLFYHVLSFSVYTVTHDGGFLFLSTLLKALLIPTRLNMERNAVCCCFLVKREKDNL